MGWWKPYNVSGTVHVDDRLDELCAIVRAVLATDEVALIGHYSGATTIAGKSNRAMFISSGFQEREFFALVSGEPDSWRPFACDLEQCFQEHGLPYSIVVHDRVVNAAGADPE